MLIGEKLKETRLEKGLTLDDVQKLTKIQNRHLQAIEKNDFSHIPGNFYVRVFIKEYANAVGLDANELFIEHQDEIPMSETAIDYSQIQRTRRKTTSTKSSPFATILPTIIVLILIIGVVFFIYRYALNGDRSNDDPTDGQNDPEVGDQVSLPRDDDNENRNDDDPDQNGGNEPDPEPEPEPEPETELLFLSYENNVSNYRLNSNEENIEIILETTSRNWLEVEDETGDRLFYEMLDTNNSPLTFDISEMEYVYLRFGNPADISISVNELEVELSEEMSDTAVQQLWLYINEDPN